MLRVRESLNAWYRSNLPRSLQALVRLARDSGQLVAGSGIRVADQADGDVEHDNVGDKGKADEHHREHFRREEDVGVEITQQQPIGR